MDNRDISAAKAQTQGLIARLAGKFGVEPNRLLKCLTTQVFKQADGRQPTNEELMVLLLVCENFGLNPFHREIYAFRLKGVDDPIVIQEFMIECFNDKSPVWRKWPRRMLRTRAFIQCARLAFSLTGLYDEGEEFAEDVSAMAAVPSGQQPQVQQPVIAQTSVPKLTLDREKLDEMLGKLITFAHNQPNGWDRAAKWVQAKLSGEDKLYVEGKLQAERMSFEASQALPPAEEVNAEAVSEEAEHAFA